MRSLLTSSSPALVGFVESAGNNDGEWAAYARHDQELAGVDTWYSAIYTIYNMFTLLDIDAGVVPTHRPVLKHYVVVYICIV